MIKREPYRNRKILDSAKGEACTLNFDGCLGKHPSVVACHSNYNFHGKGAGQKADDFMIVFGCDNCHDKLDGRKIDAETKLPSWPETKLYRFYDAHYLTMRRLFERGVIK